ncbi:MAG: hypothetical protein HRT44_05570 [Bdellovibrionales bacterium]|nr:hypothetical protein [Bdellovibrionales bacterium]NQZ18712.1 hypothetical protein [Bdellovibrionales bacterium]
MSSEGESDVCRHNEDDHEDRVVQEDEVTLERHSQRVIRYGCDENNEPTRDIVISDEWEEVRKPKMTYFLVPAEISAPENNSLANITANVTGSWDNEIEGDAYNLTACSKDNDGEDALGFILTGGISNIIDGINQRSARNEQDIEGPYISIDIDQANTAFSMRVHEGPNDIMYSFTDVCEEGSEGCVEGRKLIEKGHLKLNVIYDVKEPGEIEEVLHVDNKCPEPTSEEESE